MMIFLFLLFVYLFLVSSIHNLIILMVLEGFVLCVLFFVLFLGGSWFVGLFFLFVAICVGSYGVSLLVSLGRSKGVSYLLSFDY